ncbi:3-keto-disaccharide hydrolase [Adhaeretor mobilis]|uniref:3-keto-alpha-glucoside-1,2-lyase/3-keto-2-hydroxy-glucal hydratase domain-containing protein n=1 Tax=Adhaeretor mobilis TaxID=1930276 RepID=A0A517MV30_9BACT|nr:DUF1080 domain-containing protein [Adhaeretor mobilis]QDS98744.1 hypothetical protein HG15A2_20270 [Adhaeretor mobilis]
MRFRHATVLSLLTLFTLATFAHADDHEGKSEKNDKKEKGFSALLGEDAAQKWIGYKTQEWPKNWKVEEGVLSRTAGGGDIMTSEKYDNFDLRFDWKISEGGNSGVLYHVSTGDAQPYKSGMEYQVLDNESHKDGGNTMTSAGSLYAMYAPTKQVVKPAGEWNTGRIVVRGNRIKHFLNGKIVVDAERNGEEWNRKLAASKFATWEKFAKNKNGHISLQDHGNDVWYRNVRIKKLKAGKQKADNLK